MEVTEADRGRLKAQELEKEGSKLYNIRALWQRSQDLGISFAANSQGGLGQPSKSLPNDNVLSTCPLSDVPRGGIPSLSKRQIFTNQQVEALRDLTKLLE